MLITPNKNVIIEFFKYKNLYVSSLRYCKKYELIYIIYDLGLQWQLEGFNTQYMRKQQLLKNYSLN